MEKKRLSFEVQLTGLEEYNEGFIIGEIPVMYSGFNRNMSHISKECADKMFSKAGYIPVVAEFRNRIDNNEEVDDFGSHGGQVVIDEDGIKWVDTTIVVGCVLNEPYEMKEIDGKEYYTVRVALYKEKYPQITEILENTAVNQSMEIALVDCDLKDDGYLYVNEANLTALCLLSESVEPCFENSKIQTFANNKDRFEFEYTEIIEKVKSAFAKDSKDDDIEEDSEEEETSVEETPVETDEEKTDEETEEDFVSEDEQDKKKCKKEEEETQSNNEENDSNETVEEDEETEEEDEFSKEEYEALVVEFAKTKAEYEALKEEVVALREFKKNIDDAENKAKVDEICSQFKLEEEEIAELKEKAYSYEITHEKLEDKLFALVGRKLIKGKGFAKEKHSISTTKIKTEETIGESKYGSLTKYLCKK